MRISDWSSDVCSSDLKATNQYAEDIKGFDPPFWLDDQRNIALTNQNHDVALFEYFKPGTVLGHYFFHSRGKSAIEAAHLFLDELFSEYAVDTVVGMTPLDNKGGIGRAFSRERVGQYV